MAMPVLEPFRRRNYIALRNMLRSDPAFWKPEFWNSLGLAREAQAHGAMQKLRELAPLIALLRRRQLKVVVEIGTARGGTFYVWCKLAEPDGVIVSIDLPGGPYGGGYTVEWTSVLREYARSRQQLHFLRQDSHDERTRRRLHEILEGQEVDFLLIDGDHTYEGVRRHFELYAPFVRDGCPIAFHDILPHPHEQACEVDRFWHEIKSRYRHTEFVDPYRDAFGRQYGGIGVVYWEERSPSSPQPSRIGSRR
jgi:cephalosporin hydroxylase